MTAATGWLVAGVTLLNIVACLWLIWAPSPLDRSISCPMIK